MGIDRIVKLSLVGDMSLLRVDQWVGRTKSSSVGYFVVSGWTCGLRRLLWVRWTFQASVKISINIIFWFCINDSINYKGMNYCQIWADEVFLCLSFFLLYIHSKSYYVAPYLQCYWLPSLQHYLYDFSHQFILCLFFCIK